MSKSIKDKLSEKKKHDHEQYRDELLEDFNALFEDWKAHAEQTERKWSRQHQKAAEQIGQVSRQTRQLSEELRSIRLETVGQIKKLNQKSQWKLQVACLLSALVGGLLAAGISG